jgi:hypothetical protein
MSTTQESPPVELTMDQLALAHGPGGGLPLTAAPPPAGPVLHPPGTAGAGETAGPPPGTWHGQQILALYSTRASRTGWAYVDGAGWRRLAGTTESGHAALNALAAAARTGGGAALARDADGQVHEIYLW